MLKRKMPPKNVYDSYRYHKRKYDCEDMYRNVREIFDNVIEIIQTSQFSEQPYGNYYARKSE